MSQRHHFAGDLEAHRLGRSGRKWITSFTLHEVMLIDASGGHAHECLTDPQFRRRERHQLERFCGTFTAFNTDGIHCFGNADWLVHQSHTTLIATSIFPRVALE